MKKIAYLILAHADPEHLARLVSALDFKADFFIHIDAKVDIKPFQSHPMLDTVFFLEDRVWVSWAGISMVDATLKLMRAALSHSSDYSHLVLLSGADYPLQENELIYRHFVENPKRQFIKFIDMRDSPNHYLMQVTKQWFREPLWKKTSKSLVFVDKALRHVFRKLNLKNRWDSSVVPYFGSQWWALTPPCCQYILDYLQRDGTFYKYNRTSFSPDEHFFHTIVGNSPFLAESDGVQPYDGPGTWRMANFHVIHPSLSKWYSIDDWDETAVSDKLFIRKVNSAISKTLLDKIDSRLLIRNDRYKVPVLE